MTKGNAPIPWQGIPTWWDGVLKYSLIFNQESILKTVIASFAITIAAVCIFAADRYWVDGHGNWTDINHWSESSGGSGKATVPGENDNVIIDSNSGGSGEITLISTTVQDLTVYADASSILTLNFGEVHFKCTRDCLLYGGSIHQGAARSAILEVGRNLSTVDIAMDNPEYNLSIHLTGTGYWRYTTAGTSAPHIWNLLAAQPGHTTTLRPVGIMQQGVDIDVRNQCTFGDETSSLVVDLQETEAGAFIGLEIHNASKKLDVISSGTRVQGIDRFEHEMVGGKSGTLQNNINFVDLGIFDITGDYNAPAGSGPTWTMEGPMNLGTASLAIEKTAVFALGGHTLQVGSINIGTGSNGTGELHIQGGTATVTGRVQLGGIDKFGRINLGTGRLECDNLHINETPGLITGENNSVMEITGSAGATDITYYVSSSDGADSNNGATMTTPFETLERGLQELGAEVSVLLKRGDTLDVAVGVTVGGESGMVGAYGTGARPVIRVPADGVLNFSGSKWFLYDVVIIFGNNTTGIINGSTIGTDIVFPGFLACIGINNQIGIRFCSPVIRKGTVRVYDIQGRLIEDVPYRAGTKAVIVPKITASRVYFVLIQSGAGLFSKAVYRTK